MARTLRRLAPVLVFLALGATGRAVPPPNLPLPPCVDDEGLRSGACPDENPHLYGHTPGRLGLGGAVNVYTEPVTPACDHWAANSTGAWEPTPCYREVYPAEVVGCAYRDIVGGGFRDDVECSRALFATSAGTQLFKMSTGESGACGGAGNFWVYAYGGPATQPDRVWSARGPNSTTCALTYLGPQPDGLYGPTWVKVRVGIEVVTGPTSSDSGHAEWAEMYVPIDGDMRDLGPVAGFEVLDVRGGKVSFRNTSIHTLEEAMTYRWDFGDGKTETSAEPVHAYAEPGTYTVELTARDASGDENTYTQRLDVDFSLSVDLTVEPGPYAVDAPIALTLTVTNDFDAETDDFALSGTRGLDFAVDHLALTSGPDPRPPDRLGAGETLTFRYELTPKTSGTFEISGGAQAWLGGDDLTAQDRVTVFVPVRLGVTLATSVTSQIKQGDEFDVIATLTNNEDEEITNIKTEPLEMRPIDLLTLIGGPESEAGTDPRVDPITLAPGASTTIAWRYQADGKGVVDLRALVSGTDPYTGGLFYVSAKKRIAIEVPALELTDVRLQPGAHVPGDFGTLRATLTNIGSIDITGIDFTLAAEPDMHTYATLIEKLDPAVSPRIPKLAAGEVHEILIPVGMVSDVGERTTWSIDLAMKGVAKIDGEDTDVDAKVHIEGGLDLTRYWTTLFAELDQIVRNGALSLKNAVNTWGDTSTLGGVVVGGGEGVLNIFGKIKNGGLAAVDFFKEGIATDGRSLTEPASHAIHAILEYNATRSEKEMGQDLRNAGYAATVGSVQTFADWMNKIDKAQARGDVREVFSLVTEGGGEFLLNVALPEVAGTLLPRLLELPAVRRTVGYFQKQPEVAAIIESPELAPGATIELPELDDLPPIDAEPPVPSAKRAYAEDKADLRDIPVGVPLTGQTVARAGLTEFEHGNMIEIARDTGGAFFVRPRPAGAVKWSAAGFNGKPLGFWPKSLNDIDIPWLGYDDFDDYRGLGSGEGLVVLREPKDPFPELERRVAAGEMEYEDIDINKVLDRYEQRRAEWRQLQSINAKSGKTELQTLLDKEWTIKRYGQDVKTHLIMEESGLLVFSHNMQPIFSDIDIMQFAFPDASALPREVYDEVLKACGASIDTQHHFTFGSTDFASGAQAMEYGLKYGGEHMVNGERLIIITGDATTLGYVKSIEYPEGFAELGPGEGYGLPKAEYVGGGIR